MRDRRLHPLHLTLSVASLLAMSVGGAVAAAAPGWDAGQATQGLIVLVGFAVVLFVGLALLARAFARLSAAPRMSVADLRRRLEERDGVLVLDVRTVEDFVGEQGHIAGATNVPLEVLESRLDQLADRQRPVALVCRTDRRSAMAARLLARHGFADVRVVQGGMTAWLSNGWPVEDANPSAE
jgi:rhodanese-related sulfurtransferase